MQRSETQPSLLTGIPPSASHGCDRATRPHAGRCTPSSSQQRHRRESDPAAMLALAVVAVIVSGCMALVMLIAR